MPRPTTLEDFQNFVGLAYNLRRYASDDFENLDEDEFVADIMSDPLRNNKTMTRDTALKIRHCMKIIMAGEMLCSNRHDEPELLAYSIALKTNNRAVGINSFLKFLTCAVYLDPDPQDGEEDTDTQMTEQHFLDYMKSLPPSCQELDTEIYSLMKLVY